MRPATYDVLLREESLVRTLKPGEYIEPEDTREKVTPLGQVEIRAGETASFEARAP